MSKRHAVSSLLLAVVLAAIAPHAHAEPTAPAAQDDGGTALEFTVAPYFLFPTMTGDVAINGIDMEVNVGPSQIFENLQFGLMGYFEVRKGSWGFAFDFLYMDLATAAELAPPVEGLPPLGADFGMQQGMYELTVIRRAEPWADVIFGVRINNISSSFQAYTAPLEGDISETWVDPFVGIRLMVPSDTWVAGVRVDVGGFTAGSSIAFQIYPTVGYRVTDWVTLGGGFRYLWMDYKKGEERERFAYKMATYGPFLGAAFHF